MAGLQKYFAVILLVSGVAALAADAGFDERIHALEPMIGHYPAAIKDEADKAAVTARYEALKRDLDKALVAHPGNEKLLAQRGYLQSMGHNFDYPKAWEGADKDLRAALAKNPNDVPAILALANLWVNSDPSLAPKAELLYRGAQCNLGDKPLEEAQRGLFFAFYYQGKMREARDQAEYLKKTWPEVALYGKFAEIGGNALKKQANPPPLPTQLTMASCDKGH